MTKLEELKAAESKALRANKRETIDWLNFTLEGGAGLEVGTSALICGATEYTRSDIPPSAEVIRGMVKPLVWEQLEGAGHYYSGDYVLILFKNGYLVDYKDCAIVCDLTEDEAIAAANAHNANTILAALGLTE